MELVLGEKSEYLVSPEEKDELLAWFEQVVMAAEPEDVTDQFFVTNFIDENKRLPRVGGTVAAIVRRVAFADAPLTGLTDVVIEKGQIFESNTKKGIYIQTGVPHPDHSYSEYTAEMRWPGYPHARHNGTARLTFLPPHSRRSDTVVDLEFNTRPEVYGRWETDRTRYTIPGANQAIEAKTACTATDIMRGELKFRPLRAEETAYSSLIYQANFIAHVMGIPVPDSLKAG